MKGMPAREENDLASVRDALTHMSRGYARACVFYACVCTYSTYPTYCATLMDAHVTQGRAITLVRPVPETPRRVFFFARSVAEPPFYS